MDRYVDGLLAGTTATYNPVTRGTDGAAAGYRTLSTAYAAASAGETIYCREGECDSLTATLTLLKAVTILRYNNEDAYITVNDGDFSALSVTGAITFGAGYGDTVRLVSGGPLGYSASYRAFMVQASNAVIHADVTDYKGCPYRVTGAIGNLSGTIKVTNGKQPIVFNGTGALNTFSRVVLIGCTCATNDAPAGILQSSNGVVTISELVTIGGGCSTSGSGMVSVTNGTLTVDNPLIVGNGANHGTAVTLHQSAGVFNVNGGVVNGNITDPLNKVYSGAITFTGTAFNQCAIPVEFQSNLKCKASFVAWDSNHADDTLATAGVYSLNRWSDIFAASGKTFTYCPDDISQLSELKKTNIRSFLAVGGELGAEGESSTSFSLATGASNQPFNVYRSAGSGAVTIEIDTDSAIKTAIVKVDGVAQATINLSSAATLIGHDATSGTNYLFDVLNGGVFGTATLTAICTTLSTDAVYKNQFDDLSSEVLQSGTYSIGTTSGTATRIYIDRAKWFDFDITQAKAILLADFPSAQLKTFLNYKSLAMPSDASTAVATDGYKNVFCGVPVTGRISGFNVYGPLMRTSLAIYREPAKIRGDTIQAGIGLTAYSHGLSTNEANIRGFVRALCAASIACGLYPVIELDRKTNLVSSGLKDSYIFSDDDVTWMLDEFADLGFDVLPVGTAIPQLSGTPVYVKNGGVYGAAEMTIKGHELVGVFLKTNGTYF